MYLHLSNLKFHINLLWTYYPHLPDQEEQPREFYTFIRGCSVTESRGLSPQGSVSHPTLFASKLSSTHRPDILAQLTTDHVLHISRPDLALGSRG